MSLSPQAVQAKEKRFHANTATSNRKNSWSRYFHGITYLK